ncbi:MAG: hypothetical protein ACTSWN_08290 [Promethearchaeota archaeon]
MTKSQKTNDSYKASSSLSVQMKKILKRLSKVLNQIEDNIGGIETVPDDQRKTKVKNISLCIYDLIEDLQDLNFFLDELVGDDLLKLSEDVMFEQIDKVDMLSALVNDFEKKLKNFHKTYYDKRIDNDLKMLSYNDFMRNWRSLKRNLNKVLNEFNDVVNGFL